jgi:nitrogen fixation NifU-like protein
MNLNELYTEVIKDHNLSNHNKHTLEKANLEMPGKNPSCGDEITLYLQVENDIILDGSYTGVGCAISQASVSIMLDEVRGKTVDEAKELAQLFLSMIRKNPLTDEELEKLEDAVAFANIANMPARVKCATMPWHTLQTAIEAAEKK